MARSKFCGHVVVFPELLPRTFAFGATFEFLENIDPSIEQAR